MSANCILKQHFDIMHQFAYEPLDLVQPSFRLVRLIRGAEGLVECELFHAHVNDAGSSIDYEALSYTWGGTSRPLSISLNGEEFAVTENLHAALEHLRHEDEDRILWIDAVCINQDDRTERGHQVQQMASIYECARQVIIWLGTAVTGTDSLFDSIHALERQALSHACNDWNPADNRWRFLWAMATLDQFRDDRNQLRLCSCFKELLRRDWFQRVWILQEVAKARAAKVVCGTRSVSARFFALVPPLLRVVPEPHCQSVLDIMPGPSRRHSWWTKDRDLLTLLQKFSGSQASDPRDNIFALLGISSDACASKELVPDYGKSEAETTQNTLAFIIRTQTKRFLVGELPQWSISEFKDNLQGLPAAIRYWTQAREGIALDATSEGVPGLASAIEVIRNSHDTNALLWAAENGDEASAILALAEGVDVNAKDWLGQTPLSLAAENGYTGIVRLLLDAAGTAVHTTDWRGRTPLSWAAGKGHITIVRMLLETYDGNDEPRVQWVDKSGWTPLTLAMENKHGDIVKVLQKYMQEDKTKHIMNQTVNPARPQYVPG